MGIGTISRSPFGYTITIAANCVNAITSGSDAARAYVRGGAAAAPNWQASFRTALRRPIGLAAIIRGVAERPALATPLVAAVSRAPALLRPFVKPVFGGMLARLVDPQLQQHIAFWENELNKSEWFAGNDFTAADIQMSFPLEAASARVGLSNAPKAAAWLERIHARPAYNRALEKGGPYQLAR